MKDLKIFTSNIEQEALDQINRLMEQDAFKDSKVRIMPDVHAGAGCVIGFTANMGDKIIPNVVGVDLGCGMLTVYLGNIDIDYKKLDNAIKEVVPCGFNIHEEEQRGFVDLKDLYIYNELKDISRIKKSVGTLGGGNHFIEIDEDKNGGKYLIIHTGSRNLGLQIAKIYQNKAIKNLSSVSREDVESLIKSLKEQGRDKEISEELKKLKPRVKVPNDLAYLEGSEAQEYFWDAQKAQKYAHWNRFIIAYNIFIAMDWDMDCIEDRFETVHNYISEDNIVRKGAISASYREKVLIPISMKDGCILGYGRGNREWNESAPHGAGRLLSRTKAREILNVEDFKDDMKGIYTTTANANTIDESPRAYKSLDEIVENIKDTVDIIEILKPVYNFKAE